MDKLTRFIDCYISTETCNLRCKYCYIAQNNKFNSKLVKFEHSSKEIAKALSQKRLGGTCLLNFCAGGETLLAQDVIPVIRALLEEGHYIMIVTNGTISKRFDEITEFPIELRKRIFFKFSFHYLELKRLNWLEKFVDNVNKIKNSGCSYTIEVTPSDDLIPYIEDLKNDCIKYFGALCHVTIARDDREYEIGHLSNLSFEDYIKTWSVFQSELFDFKSTIFYKRRKEFCYAGEYTLSLNLSSGDLRQCYCGKKLCNIYDNPLDKISFRAIGNACGYSHCYNGHVFLTMGAVPDIKTPNYDRLRNRIEIGGTEWLSPEMKSFMQQKVSDNQARYNKLKKIKSNIFSLDLMAKAFIKSIVKKKDIRRK